MKGSWNIHASELDMKHAWSGRGCELNYILLENLTFASDPFAVVWLVKLATVKSIITGHNNAHDQRPLATNSFTVRLYWPGQGNMEN